MSAEPQPGRPNRNRRLIPNKEKPCQRWLKGNCPLGNDCKFRHAEGAKREVKEHVQRDKEEYYKPNKPGSATNLGGSELSILTGAAGLVLTQTLSTGGEVANTTQKGKEKIIAAKTEVNGSTSNLLLCGGWRWGTCARGHKCPYKHESPQIIQVPNVRGQLANEDSQRQNSRGDGSARGSKPISEKTTKAEAKEGPKLQALSASGSRNEDVLDRIRAAMDDAREAGQPDLPPVALVEEENRRKSDTVKMLRVAEEAREVAEQEQLALVEEENRRKEEAMAMERAEREAALREEENRHREEATAKARKAKARAAKEAREARSRELALKREAKRRENEERIARERAEREAREEAEREAREEAERKAREEAERKAREKAEREEREEAERRHQQEIAARREKEAAAVEQYVVSETSLVTCSAGFNIQHVIPGFELCRIIIKNLPRDAKREEIVDMFIQQGVQSSDFLVFQMKVIGNKQEAVVLANTEHGEAILRGLDGTQFRDEILNLGVSNNMSWNALGTAGQNTPFITVSWRSPGETIVANYRTMEEAQRKMRKLDKKIWKGWQITARMNDAPKQGGLRSLQKFVPESVKLFNCPPGSAIDEEFYQFIGSYNVSGLNSSAPFDFQESFNITRDRVARLRGAKISTYQILKRDQFEGEAKVKVEFDEWEDAKLAHVAISKQRIGLASAFYQCWLPKQLQYKITIPRQQYESQKKQWDSLGEKKGAVDDPYVQAQMGDRGGVFIEIVGKEKKTAGPLKVRVENMIAGEKLDSTFWHPSFATPKSKGFFDQIFVEKKVFVRSDFKTQSLKIYGESNAIEEARQRIKREVRRLGQMETTRVLNQELVGYFVREGVGKLEEMLGEENVRLVVQPRMCRITIKGGKEANHYLQRLIEQARVAIIVDSVLPDDGEEDTCPVCYGDLSHPEKLGCGHWYCSGCLKHLLTSAIDNKTFPLVCVGNDATCNVPIAIPFIRHFLPAETFNSLIEAAFHAYLEQHQRELKYCTTPDCKQIYRRRRDKTALQCPACFSTICPSCDEKAHPGMSCCEEQRIDRYLAEQERLNEELAASSGYKRCPSCTAMIEKTEGCNHMTCRCGAHICWKCTNVFESGRETYDHLQTVHGGIYEEGPAGAGVVVWDAWDQEFLGGQVEEMARIERVRAAAEAEEQARGVRAVAEAEERLRRARAAELYGQWDAQARQVRLAQEAAARRREEDRGWCILM